MATSGSSDFTRTRDQLIIRSLRLLGVLKAGRTPGAQQITDGAEALNAMVKRWQKKGLRVWTVSEATLFPQVGQIKYALAKTGADHATEAYVQTALSADEASGQTTLSVDDTSEISADDHLGVVIDDGTLFWSTVASKTSSTVTLDDALTDSAADGALVFAYTNKIERPIKVVDARRYNIVSQFDTPIRMEARFDYRALPNKAQQGQITSVFYDPQLSTGYMHLWQPVSAITDLVNFTWHRPIMDFDSAGDNPDLPVEWFDAIAFNLAVSMAAEYDAPMERVTLLAQQAATYLDDAAGDDREVESIFAGVDMGP
jgi:hypothetical protein